MDWPILRQALWAELRLPVRILLTGLVVIGLVRFAWWSLVPNQAFTLPMISERTTQTIIGILIFAVGLAFAAFLWWLAARYFSLFNNEAISAEKLAGLKDLPLALPEGTVRAMLALIVGVVGIPLLLFSNVLGLKDAIAGYVNGIVTGVFAFYFGTRVAGTDGQTVRQAMRALDQAQSETSSLRQAVGNAAEAASRPGKLAKEIERIDRHLAAAELLLNVFGPALPKGLLPEGLADVLAKARSVADKARLLTATDITDANFKEVGDVAAEMVMNTPLATLLKTAGGLFPAVTSPAGLVALILGLGWQFSAEQYQRWRSRILSAPYEPKTIQIGAITGTSARLHLEQSPIFAAAFAEEKDKPGFFNDLVTILLTDQAPDLLWARYGQLFASRSEMQEGLDQFRRGLLGIRAASDVTDEAVGKVAGTLAGANVAFKPSVLKAAELNTLLDQLAERKDIPEAQQASLQALVMLVGHLRERNVDPAQLIAELTP